MGDTVVSRENENWRRWGGGGGDEVYFGQFESCETTVKRKAAIKHCQSVANVVVIFIDTIDGKLSRDNPR